MKIRNLLLVFAVMLLGLSVLAISGCDKDDNSPDGSGQGGKQSANVAGGEFVNARCPIMGTEIDPSKVTDDLVRMHRGQRIAFCCGGCPGQWDALSDEEKDAKLAEAK